MCRAGLVDVIPLKPGAGSRLVVSDIDWQISCQAQLGVGNLTHQVAELRVQDVVGLRFGEAESVGHEAGPGRLAIGRTADQGDHAPNLCDRLICHAANP